MSRLSSAFVFVRQWLRQRLCSLVHGGHEFYEARTTTRLYRECLLCRYKTAGWELEAKPRFRRQLAGRPRVSQRRRFWWSDRRVG